MGKVAGAAARLMRPRELVDFAVGWMEAKHPACRGTGERVTLAGMYLRSPLSFR